MAKRIVCFGEIMMRLNPEGYLRFVQAEKFECSYGGGEANVAVSLANYGMDASYVTKLPDNPLGASARNEVRRFGVDTKDIVWGGPRLGIYFVEKGASQRASKVVYDRAGSSIATASRKDFDWAKILKGAKWFHFTGITPALGGECPDICLDALKYCKTHKITVSCDLNYRGKLWTRAQAGATMAKLVPYVDVCIANEADAADQGGLRLRRPPARHALRLQESGHYAPYLDFRVPQQVGRHAFRWTQSVLLSRVRHPDRRPRGWRRLLRRRAHLRPRERVRHAGRHQLRSCGFVPEALDRA